MKKLSVALAIALALAPQAGHAVDATPLARWQADQTTVLDASETALEDFLWVARPVVVFADSPANPLFQEQMDLLTARIGELARRDVVVVTDTRPEPVSPLREKLRPRGFMLVVIGKDGGVKLRKPFPWDVREITRSIDKFPLRQQEIRHEHGRR
ncbi:uncharacterized protein DUF4174 [Rhodovulum imhoffii]|uniref:Uncharacterized protein DUF4174 n=1 Tax=Rhodovulum imhoffii TaxID=365340 RepID=A0A2T5BW55_9RHOB|nr:DUF4174 domain-containing protein [Rhodovulum imhoffii]MBK5935158.1 hypothetical protein [Rhodovulum imhoffii]PTN03875.1 uncharacterized protein DUF4174 [Rhodovulum imhoffii]